MIREALAAIVDCSRQVGRDLVGVALPGACASCRDVHPQADPLCPDCLKLLRMLAAEACCDRCASPLPMIDSPCGRCGGRGFRPFNQVVRLALHDGVARDVVHAMKYDCRWAICRLLADLLLEKPQVSRRIASADVLVPIPLHWRRHVARGFNQAEEIARHLARRADRRMERHLTRVKPTPSQTAFHSRRARAMNMRGVFRGSNLASLAGKHVLLVDDVMTSGATLREAARLLRPARPASISALVITAAHPMRSSLSPI
jgi:ComF family protein